MKETSTQRRRRLLKEKVKRQVKVKNGSEEENYARVAKRRKQAEDLPETQLIVAREKARKRIAHSRAIEAPEKLLSARKTEKKTSRI